MLSLNRSLLFLFSLLFVLSCNKFNSSSKKDNSIRLLQLSRNQDKTETKLSIRGRLTDSSGVYILDYTNNRALYYPGTSTTATVVWGQGGSFTTGTANNGGISAGSLQTPYSIRKGADGLYISDYKNNRVLFY
ncbi:MAG: hypothetical protein H7A25_22630 [Leptospiraceae bacterium]|nr:hypothetical protein [Leptospiraceae bacterium]MCP5502712.1 hypothetical protein [Leptospiraceae bacterium]